MKHLIVPAVSLLLCVSNALADTSHEAVTVRRSASGGNGSADVITIEPVDAQPESEVSAEAPRAQLKGKSLEESTQKAVTVQRSMSGGSGAADRIVIPAQKQ